VPALSTGGKILTFGLGGTAIAPPTYASTFSIVLSSGSGTVGTNTVMTVAPVGGPWPVGVSATGTKSTLVGAFDAPTKALSGSTPATFTFTSSGVSGPDYLNATVPGMPSTGGQLYTATAAVVTPPPSTNLTRFDAVFDQSVVAPGGTATGKLIPNANWASGNAVLTPNSGAAVTVALPSSGNSPVSFSVTAPGTEGELSYTVTNTASVVNPYSPPLNVMTNGNGTAATITASLTRSDFARFQRDAVSGNPAGFSASWARGWGEVWLTLGQAGQKLFMRLHDSATSGATTTAGTGTALTGVVQVHGAFVAGTVRVLLPAGPYQYWADVATDAAFTNPVRVAQRFGVGIVVGVMSRSQETGFANPYADGTAFTQIYNKLSVLYGNSTYGNGSGVWATSTDTSAGQELARILEAQHGVIVGITGISDSGGGLDHFVTHGGLSGSYYQGNLLDRMSETVGPSCGKKFRYLTMSMGNWDGVDAAYPTETYAEDQTRLQSAFIQFPLLFPACAVIRCMMGGPTGWFGSDGSAAMGYTRLTKIVRDVEAANAMIVSGESTLWNEFANGHATQGARPDYARTAARMMLSADPLGGLSPANRGPTMAASGTVVGRVLRIPYALHGGANLVALRAHYTNPTVTYGTASTAELASLWSVYGGTGGRSGAGKAIKIDSATINTGAGTIDLVLTGTSGITYADNTTAAMPSAFTVHYGADFGSSYPRLPDGTGSSLADDVSEYGIPYGRLMRPALDIVIS
jgi:hypothetical protein